MGIMILMLAMPLSVSAKVKISNKTLTLTVGTKYKLGITGTKKKAKWTTSKKSVATVSKAGTVSAKKVGTATITAKVGGKKLRCKVYVKKVDPKAWTMANLDSIYNELDTALTYVKKAEDHCKYQGSYNSYIAIAKSHLQNAVNIADSKYPVAVQDGNDFADYLHFTLSQVSACEKFVSSERIGFKTFYNVPVEASRLATMIAKAKVHVSYLRITMVLN